MVVKTILSALLRNHFYPRQLAADIIDRSHRDTSLICGGERKHIDDGVEQIGDTTVRLPLWRGDHPLRQHYCAFWKTDNCGYYVEVFSELLKAALLKTGE